MQKDDGHGGIEIDSASGKDVNRKKDDDFDIALWAPQRTTSMDQEPEYIELHSNSSHISKTVRRLVKNFEK